MADWVCLAVMLWVYIPEGFKQSSALIEYGPIAMVHRGHGVENAAIETASEAVLGRICMLIQLIGAD